MIAVLHKRTKIELFREMFEESGFEVYESRESFIEYVLLRQAEVLTQSKQVTW